MINQFSEGACFTIEACIIGMIKLQRLHCGVVVCVCILVIGYCKIQIGEFAC